MLKGYQSTAQEAHLPHDRRKCTGAEMVLKHCLASTLAPRQPQDHEQDHGVHHGLLTVVVVVVRQHGAEAEHGRHEQQIEKQLLRGPKSNHYQVR